MTLDVATVVPTYQPRYLDETLASLEAQTRAPREVVVVDDGSEPPVRLHSVRVHRIAHSGISAARNAGAEITSAPLLHVCDHDDVLAPGFYERIVRVFENRPELGVVHCALGSIEADGTPRPGLFPANPPDYAHPLRGLLHENSLGSVATVFRREVYDALGGFRAFHYVQDWDFWIRAAAAGFRFGYLDEMLAVHREHEEKQYRRENRAAIVAESVEMLRTVRVPPGARVERARALAGMRLQLATAGVDPLRQMLMAFPLRPRTSLRMLAQAASR